MLKELFLKFTNWLKGEKPSVIAKYVISAAVAIAILVDVIKGENSDGFDVEILKGAADAVSTTLCSISVLLDVASEKFNEVMTFMAS